MTTERPIEVEPLDAADSLAKAIRAVIDESVKLADSLGKAVVSTSQDLLNVMVIRVDHDTRQHLDALVQAGAAPNRCKAAVALIQEGIKVQQPLFDRIQRTQTQITELRQQLRSLIGSPS